MLTRKASDGSSLLPTWAAKREAAEALGALGEKASSALAALRDGLDDWSVDAADLRVAAAVAVARIDPSDEAWLQPLLASLRDRSPAGCGGQRAAVLALGTPGPRAKLAAADLRRLASLAAIDDPLRTAIARALEAIEAR